MHQIANHLIGHDTSVPRYFLREGWPTAGGVDGMATSD